MRQAQLDMHATALQETGTTTIIGLTVADIVELINTGLDPKKVKVGGSLSSTTLKVGK